MQPHRESLTRRLAREYVIHRLGGRPAHHSSWRGYGRPSYRWSRRRPPTRWGMRTPYGTSHRRRAGGVQVRGCGCCLPIPLALATAAFAGVNVAARSARR